MIYDLRIYTPHEGKSEALRRRFVDQVLPIFARLGIEVVERLDPIGGSGAFWYLTRFVDEQARDTAWVAFKNDPEWLAIKAASEASGPLLKEQQMRLFTHLD